MVAVAGDVFSEGALQRRTAQAAEFARRNPTVVVSASVLLAMALMATFATHLAPDPMALNPAVRLKPPCMMEAVGFEFTTSCLGWFGTDHLGRDVYARTVFGARISPHRGACGGGLQHRPSGSSSASSRATSGCSTRSSCGSWTG